MKIDKFQIDLHGYNRAKAAPTISKFIHSSVDNRYRTILIIHGKGTWVLRKFTRQYLKKSSLVENFYDAPSSLGGAGAQVVKLKVTPIIKEGKLDKRYRIWSAPADYIQTEEGKIEILSEIDELDNIKNIKNGQHVTYEYGIVATGIKQKESEVQQEGIEEKVNKKKQLLNLKPINKNIPLDKVPRPTEDEFMIYKEFKKEINKPPNFFQLLLQTKRDEKKIIEKITDKFGLTYEQVIDINLKVKQWYWARGDFKS